MSLILHGKLRHRRARVVAAIVIAAIALSVGMAHSAMGGDHMGEAVAICLAIGVAATALAAAPRLGRKVPPPARPQRRTDAIALCATPIRVLPGRARGHPSHLQVFRR